MSVTAKFQFECQFCDNRQSADGRNIHVYESALGRMEASAFAALPENWACLHDGRIMCPAHELKISTVTEVVAKT